MKKIVTSCLCLLFFSHVFAQVERAFFGNYALENGEVLEDAQLGYQTYGKLNSNKSNAILFPTWYAGTGESLKPYIGREAMIDTTKFHLIVVDALGNGISSSPSNGILKKDKGFPEFSIKDMVDLQYKLVTEVLEIPHLYAVTGISMGGMQTYQWMATYPTFFDKAIPIVGTPKLSVYDELNYEIFKNVLANEMENPKQDATFLMLEYALGLTPKYFYNDSKTKEELFHEIREEAGRYQVADLYSQMRAISMFDLGDELNAHQAKSLAELFKGDALIIYSTTDHLVSPLANLITIEELKAQSLDLMSDCGHYAFGCDIDKISQAVRDFLE